MVSSSEGDQVSSTTPPTESRSTVIVRAYTCAAAGLLGALWGDIQGLLETLPPYGSIGDPAVERIAEFARRVGRDAMKARRLLVKASRARGGA